MHSRHDLLAQRSYQIDCGHEDGNDAHDPMFKLGTSPFEAEFQGIPNVV